jgi:arylsulfatase A-like enzyme
MTHKPNILFFHVDQQRYDCLGAAGQMRVHTPNLDRLASQGMWFTNAFTPIGTCCPARQTSYCGRWPALHRGYWNYDQFMPPESFACRTWSQDLNTAGYQASYAGKWHVHPTLTPLEYGYAEYVPSSDYAAFRRARNLPDLVCDDVRGEWFGGVDPAPLEQTRTHWLAYQATGMLRRLATCGKPWHLRVDFEEPHLPCNPVQEFLDLYDPAQIQPWGNFADPLDGKPYIQRQQPASWNVQGLPWSEWSRYVHRYLAMVSQIDDAIGRVLRELEVLGEDRDTVVMYTTDHGDACGSHGMMDKHYVMYEEIIHTPLMVRWPGVVRGESVCDAFVINELDLASTLPEIAGIPVPEDYQGRSLVPLLRGETPADWRTEAYSSYNGQQFGLYVQRMIRTRDWKYVWNLTDTDELYDLQNDPGEIKNRIADPACVELIAGLRRQLLDELRRQGDGVVKSPWTVNQLTGACVKLA